MAKITHGLATLIANAPLDHGENWIHVVQVTFDEMTTHYVDIPAIRNNKIQAMQDIGHWHDGYWNGESGRYTGLKNLVMKLDTQS